MLTVEQVEEIRRRYRDCEKLRHIKAAMRLTLSLAAIHKAAVGATYRDESVSIHSYRG